jgi:hypothetical protein
MKYMFNSFSYLFSNSKRIFRKPLLLVAIILFTIPICCNQTLAIKEQSYEDNNQATVFIETLFENDTHNDKYLIDPNQFSLRICNLMLRSDSKQFYAVSYDNRVRQDIQIQIRIGNIHTSLDIADEQQLRNILTLGLYGLANGNIRYEKFEVSGEIIYSNIINKKLRKKEFNLELKNEYGAYDEEFKFIGNVDNSLFINIGDRNPIYSSLFLPSFEKMILQLIYED